MSHILFPSSFFVKNDNMMMNNKNEIKAWTGAIQGETLKLKEAFPVVTLVLSALSGLNHSIVSVIINIQNYNSIVRYQ